MVGVPPLYVRIPYCPEYPLRCSGILFIPLAKHILGILSFGKSVGRAGIVQDGQFHGSGKGDKIRLRSEEQGADGVEFHSIPMGHRGKGMVRPS